MKTLNVDLGDRSYPIHIGAGILTDATLWAPHIAGSEVCVVTNDTIAPLYLEKITDGLADKKLCVEILPDGEAHKTFEAMNRIFDRLLENRHSRKSTLIALGGGVVGDITGFAAACYQRGINFIQMPTTLLSQVDSSVGGKTGVNHPLGKNMIGAFHQPECVVADLAVLTTLPQREYAAGVAEVIKYGLLGDVEFLEWIEANAQAFVAKDMGVLEHAVLRSCENKARIVAQDEKESGVRALLNLGHTFGHAIEHAQGYGAWLHGEAVAAGMVLAAKMSAQAGWLTAQDVERVVKLLKHFDLPVDPPADMTITEFLDAMGRDKKVIDGALRLVLLKSLGDAVVTDQFGNKEISNLLASVGLGD